VPTPVVAPPVVMMNEEVEPIHQAPDEPVDTQEEEQQQPQIDEAPQAQARGRPQRIRKRVISDDYEVYNSEGIQMEDNPTSFEEAMRSEHSSKWLDAMEDEIKSMSTNKVWDLEEIPKGAKAVGCKWVYKTKYDSQGNIDKFKARLVANGYTQREGIDYNEIFSPVSCKDSFRIIMALVGHYDLELHQMDVKTAFLNGDLDETVYMA
jgi:hypothetical protein